MSDGTTMIKDAIRGETILFAGTAVNVLVPSVATDGAFALLRIANPSGCWTPQHRHQVEHETVYILSGTLRAEVPDGARDLLPGQALVLPRGRPHQLGNAATEETHFLVLCTPGGFDNFVRAAGRLAAASETPAMTEADVVRLMEAAPRYGIELLAPDGATPFAASTTDGPAVHDVLDVLGLEIEVLAEPGHDADDVCLMRGRFPPDAEVPWHGHADHVGIYVLDGALDVATGAAGEATCTTVGAGGTFLVPSGVPHVIRNRGSASAIALLVTTQRVADLFREVGRTPGAVQSGPSSPERLDALAIAARARGFTRGEAEA